METNEYEKMYIPDNITTIVPKGRLKDDISKCTIIDFLCKYIQKMPEYSKRRTDFELIKIIANLVENIITERKSGQLKRDICLSVFNKTFNLTAIEQKTISDLIEDIKNNKKIKKINIYKKYIKPFGGFLKKKLLD